MSQKRLQAEENLLEVSVHPQQVAAAVPSGSHHGNFCHFLFLSQQLCYRSLAVGVTIDPTGNSFGTVFPLCA